MNTIFRKMCLIGDFGVGKTSLIRRFVDNQFSDKYLSTVGVKISRKGLTVAKDGTQEVQLMIWDLEGHTKFKSIAANYLQGAKGAVVVADHSREETKDRIIDHLQLFASVNPQGIVILALNKMDLVSQEEAEGTIKHIYKHYVNNQVISVYNTSAKTGEGVDRIFQELAFNML